MIDDRRERSWSVRVEQRDRNLLEAPLGTVVVMDGAGGRAGAASEDAGVDIESQRGVEKMRTPWSVFLEVLHLCLPESNDV